MTKPALLVAKGIDLDTPTGRPLLRDLHLSLERERVAIVGRNGVGKSTLLSVLAGLEVPTRGRVIGSEKCLLIPQHCDTGAMSPGQWRKQALAQARQGRPEVLLLDEPTRDLDAASVRWLCQWLQSYDGAALIVSHDRRLLRQLHAFFVIAEAGCQLFLGSFEALLSHLESAEKESQRRYHQNLIVLADKEEHNDQVRRRRERKKNLGRVRELKRCPARAKLNGKRSYAQESQAKRALLQEDRIDKARDWARATRRALQVALPLAAVLPTLPLGSAEPYLSLQGVSAKRGGRTLFSHLTQQFGRERWAICGANGSGKSTLLEILTGQRPADQGRVRGNLRRVGYIAQNASNFHGGASLTESLVEQGVGEPEIPRLLAAHRFPALLAARPLISLSPGERVRAALVCLLSRCPAVELLVLDEPTDDLDLLGWESLRALLNAFQGGLVIVSHDEEFLAAVGVRHRIELTPTAAPS